MTTLYPGVSPEAELRLHDLSPSLLKMTPEEQAAFITKLRADRMKGALVSTFSEPRRAKPKEAKEPAKPRKSRKAVEAPDDSNGGVA